MFKWVGLERKVSTICAEPQAWEATGATTTSSNPAGEFRVGFPIECAEGQAIRIVRNQGNEKLLCGLKLARTQKLVQDMFNVL
mmetsp:Transcript_28696/g.84612  ORF Transcript_28696/g.84612 Transcript_28696/m.84612 type:complete len:83 (-) Transcript_28696:176-424(-)